MKNKHIIKHKQILKKALSLMRYEESFDTYCFHGNIFNLDVGFRLSSFPTALRKDRFISLYITNDLWSISSLVSRLEFIRKLALTNEDLEKLWYTYAGLDIEHIYIKFISLCNHFANLIWGCFDEIPNSKKDSFRELLVWIFNNPSRVTPELLNVFKKADLYKSKADSYKSWFGHMREIRDSINHEGAQASLCGSPKDGFLFQIQKAPLKNSIPTLPHIKFNDNVVFFDKYFSVQIANLFLFSEELAKVIIHKYQISPMGAKASGFDTVYLWMSDFYNSL